jgi:DNA-directed RNA polymerase subunit E'/Rpb7
MKAQEKTKEEKGMKMKIGDFVFAEYDNGEIVNGEVVNVRNFGERVLLTVKAEQGYRSIYLDKCVTFDHMQAAN